LRGQNRSRSGRQLEKYEKRRPKSAEGGSTCWKGNQERGGQASARPGKIKEKRGRLFAEKKKDFKGKKAEREGAFLTKPKEAQRAARHM